MRGRVPRKGDFIALSFDPQSGHEQKGRRPALVISNDLFNRHTGLAIVCPVTRTDRGFPFHVKIPPGSHVAGFVMTEQVRSLDFSSRGTQFIAKAPTGLLEEVLAILDSCIY
ncbi:MAG: type II toxin-antitoxin system PemK/MazF family toxin [Candidatus Hydrogenedentes bacterium]|nr:type II toxin-antitoxin system PemK/MazF family toxin [Candidatus Hydrogenedentota bacterium]